MSEYLSYDIFMTRVHAGHYRKKAVPFIKTSFKKDLLRAHRVSDNPKAEKAYDIAWDYGHSHGEASVADYFYDLVELIK